MNVIGLIGKKLSGKDSVFKALREFVPHGQRIAFADPLKIELAAACGVSVEYLEEHKEVFRAGLQWWGTEFRRGLFGDDYWVNLVDSKLKHLSTATDRGLAVITDVRFQKRGGRRAQTRRKDLENHQVSRGRGCTLVRDIDGVDQCG